MKVDCFFLARSTFAEMHTVTILNSEIVKATITKAPYRTRLSNNDVVMPKVYTASVLFYKNTNNDSNFMSVDRLKESLAKILGKFYELSGRLVELDDGNLEVDSTNEGVQFVIAVGNFDMAALEEEKFGQTSMPNDLINLSMADGFLFKVQVTYLTDKSVILSTAMHHSLADGHGNFSFLKCWADVCRSPESLALMASFEGTERQFLLGRKEGPKYQHPEYRISSGEQMTEETKQKFVTLLPRLTARIFHFDKKNLNKLKQTVLAQLAPSNKYVSSNDALAALFWKSVTRARAVSSDTLVKFGMACNGRKRLSPSLSDSYFGNVNFFVYAELDSQTLHTSALSEVSLVIRKGVDKCSNADWCEDCLSWVEVQKDKRAILPGFNSFLDKDFAVTSWASFPIFEINFGFGTPVSFRIPVKAFDGLAIFLPSADGGIDVTIGLLDDAMAKLIADDDLTKFCECLG